jgi:hypothetical protein
MGIGKEITIDQFLNFEWINKLENIELYKSGFERLDSKFKGNGLTEVIKATRETLL